ncbi:MAG: SOS response-associated peptidase [Rhodospirillaceae bacterium]|nr:SOS response-associated peptidase [Rhodospirillaceae bacterium]
MCSRYEILTPFESIVAGRALGISPSDEDAQRARKFPKGEVRPTDMAPVILSEHTIGWMPWGLSVSWQSQPVINARAETLEQKPTFRPLLEQRCLVPASAYFEWRTAGRSKIKTRISLAESNGLMFAGLIGDGRFTIVTCAPAPSIAHIHDRMPVLLEPEAQLVWLSTQRKFVDVKGVLVPCRAALKAEEISPPARQGELAL